MTCASCELLIEDQFQKIPGVKSVKVSQRHGKATLVCKRVPSQEELQRAIAGHGYEVIPQDPLGRGEDSQGMGRSFLEIGAMLIIIFGLYLFFKTTGVLDFNLGIADNMSYGFIFLIGLVAASSSCIAVTGGVLLSVAAKYNEACLSGRQAYSAETRWEKFKPHLLFNSGRIISYTLLGGLIGALGSVFSISPRMTGAIGLLAAFFMIGMGFHILKIFPSRFSLKMPKFIGRRILKLQEHRHPSIPFLMGALTFFLPCGFTQALQLYAISRGSMIEGALIMFFFSLGTLPTLLSLGSISSFAKGNFQRYFLTFSGVVVLLLGFFNINNSLALLGLNTAQLFSFSSAQVFAEPARIENGRQIVSMKINGLSYEPSEFTVLQGVPVEWQVDGKDAVGCGQIIIMPTMDITAFLPKDSMKTITFTPKELGTIPFNCTMGMMTSGAAFHVVANTAGVVGAAVPDTSDNKPCDPAVTSCNVQKVDMEISETRGFYPRLHTVKKGIPVELTIDDQVNVGSCMGTFTIPEYGVAKLLKAGQKSLVTFTPTHTGTLNAVCSMGMLQTTFNVIE